MIFAAYYTQLILEALALNSINRAPKSCALVVVIEAVKLDLLAFMLGFVVAHHR
jgi:hypothetical protein